MLNPYEVSGLAELVAITGGLCAMPNAPLALVCIDESGKFADSHTVSLAACMARSDTFVDLTRAWGERLRRDGISFTSMKDALHLDGPFRAWRPATDETNAKRDSLLWDLASLIANAPMRRLVVSFKSETFRALPSDIKAKLGKDPYYAAFEACIVGCLNGNRYNLAIHADLAEEYSEKCVKLFHKMRSKRSDLKSAVTGITFADDTVMPGLQMADMVSYCARAEAMKEVVVPHSIAARIIRLFHSQDHIESQAFYLESGNGLGEVQIDESAGL